MRIFLLLLLLLLLPLALFAAAAVAAAVAASCTSGFCKLGGPRAAPRDFIAVLIGPQDQGPIRSLSWSGQPIGGRAHWARAV